MKYLLVFLICSFAFSGYSPESEVVKKINDCSYSLEVFLRPCESCIEINKDFKCEYAQISNEMIDDLSSPIWDTRSDIEACVSESDCQDKMSAKSCTDGRWPLMNAEFTEVWCNKITGYNQIASGKKIITEDSAKKSAYESLKASQSAEKLELESRLKRMSQGKELVALIANRNDKKTLTPSDIATLFATYRDINDALSSGSLTTAQYLITQVTPDAVIMTQADKDFALAKITEYLAE